MGFVCDQARPCSLRSLPCRQSDTFFPREAAEHRGTCKELGAHASGRVIRWATVNCIRAADEQQPRGCAGRRLPLKKRDNTVQTEMILRCNSDIVDDVLRARMEHVRARMRGSGEAAAAAPMPRHPVRFHCRY